MAIGLDQLVQEEHSSQDQIRARLRELWQDTADISSDAGCLSRELHSCSFEQLGLVPAIRDLCSDLSRRHGIRIEFADEAIPQQVPQETALCLFRIAQEALRNAVKHSQADVIRAELSGGPEDLELRVRDASVGFDPVSASRKGRLGLMSIRERALIVGGEISINSQSSRGTEVSVRVPLRNAHPRPVRFPAVRQNVGRSPFVECSWLRDADLFLPCTGLTRSGASLLIGALGQRLPAAFPEGVNNVMRGRSRDR